VNTVPTTGAPASSSPPPAPDPELRPSDSSSPKPPSSSLTSCRQISSRRSRKPSHRRQITSSQPPPPSPCARFQGEKTPEPPGALYRLSDACFSDTLKTMVKDKPHDLQINYESVLHKHSARTWNKLLKTKTHWRF
jgi:hypothetical protein